MAERTRFSPKLIIPIAVLVAGVALVLSALRSAEVPVPAGELPAPPEVAVFRVSSTPGDCEVRYDDLAVGRTPLRLEREADRRLHTLEILCEGFLPHEEDVLAEGERAVEVVLGRALDETAPKAVAPAPPPPAATGGGRLAKVVIFSRPTGARVKWDGEDVGPTPAVFQRPADDAEHELEVSLNGYPPVKLKRVLSADLLERVDLAR